MAASRPLYTVTHHHCLCITAGRMFSVLEYAVGFHDWLVTLQTRDECVRLSGTELSHMSGRENEHEIIESYGLIKMIL